MSIYKLIFYLVKLNLKCDSKVLCPKSHQDILKQLLSVLKRLSLLHINTYFKSEIVKTIQNPLNLF